MTMENEYRMFTGGFVQTNAYAFQARDGWLLFDAPEGVSGWMTELGLKAGLLVLTHLHFDHITDAARVSREHGCRIISMAAPDPELTLEKFFGGFGMLGGVEPFLPDERIDPADGRIDLLGSSFQLYHVPGHSPDSRASSTGKPGCFSAGTSCSREGSGGPISRGATTISSFRGFGRSCSRWGTMCVCCPATDRRRPSERSAD